MRNDVNKIKQFYSKRYKQFGYSPKSLGWDKGKQQVRFDVLTSQYDFNGRRVLDIGCGFGDFATYLHSKHIDCEYTGVDLSEEFIGVAQQLHPEAQFLLGDFLTIDFTQSFDYAIASGTFNLRFSDGGNYRFLQSVIDKVYGLCSDGFAFDFLSDKVDYELPDTFHYAPERVLAMAYGYSRNVVLRNDYMPFEFSLFVHKNDRFVKEDTLFERYKAQKGLTRN